MLQNLLGSALGAPVTTAPVLENTPDNVANSIESNLKKFDKSLIDNGNTALAPESDSTPLPAAAAQLSGTVALPAEALEPLRLALGGLLDVLVQGSQLPASGNALPPGLHQQIETALERLQLSLPELDVSELGALAKSLDLDVGALQSVLDSVAALQQALHSALPLAAGTGLPLDAGVVSAELQALVAPAVPIPAAADAVPGAPLAVSQETVKPAPLLALVNKVGEVLSQARSILQHALDQGSAVAPQRGSPALAAAVQPMTAAAEAGVAGVARNLATGAPLATVAAARPATAQSATAKPGAVAPDVAPPAALPSTDKAITLDQQWSRSALQVPAPVPALASQPLLPAALLQARHALAAGGDATLPGASAVPDSQVATLSTPALAAAAQAGLLLPATHASTQTFTTQVALPVVNTQWGSQIAQRIGWLTGQGINSAAIHLNPPELGPMQVRIDSAEQAARVTISVHNAMTREALEMQLPRLRDLFSEQGLELVDVDVEQHDFAGGGSHAAAGDGGDDSGRASGDSAASDAAVTAAGSSEPLPDTGNSIVLHYALVDAYA